MTISSWLSWPNSRSGALHAKRPDSAARLKKARFTLEPLEARALLASFTAASVSALIADINAANTNGGANTITLTAATNAPYVLTAANNTTDGATGLPVIAANDNLTIVGGGDTVERSTASGTAAFRLLNVATGGSLTLENLTLQGGLASPTPSSFPPAASFGGAIYNQGALTLNGVTVEDNGALEAGGGICSYGGSVTLEGGTSVSANQVSEQLPTGFIPEYNSLYALGAGLYAENATVTVTNATIDSNRNVSGDAEACGGGMCVVDSTVTVTNSTLDNNSVTGSSGPFDADGGGLYARGDDGIAAIGPGDGLGTTVTLTNTTVENNSADMCNSLSPHGFGFGGGLCIQGATLALSNDTVESNIAGDLKGLTGTALTRTGYGGGLYVLAAVTATLVDDTIASNSAVYGGGVDLSGGTTILSNDTVESNAAYHGGGLFLSGTATFSNDTIESNTASCGGGLYINVNSSITLDLFTVAHTINNTDESGLNGTTANIDGTYTLS